MKRVLAFLLACVLSLSIVCCALAESNVTAAPNASDQSGRVLIVYFSWSSAGNTEQVAKVLQAHIGADLLRLEPAVPYPADYSECGEVAKAERDANARPGLANLPDKLDAYDIIFVGYPIWWHTAPMVIGTFLESYDFTGKQLYPFSQSASMDVEQFAASMEFVQTCAKGATVQEGLFVDASDLDGILAYLAENGFGEGEGT